MRIGLHTEFWTSSTKYCSPACRLIDLWQSSKGSYCLKFHWRQYNLMFWFEVLR